MIKKLINYIRREDEIKRLKRDVQCLHILLNRLDECQRFEINRLSHKVLAMEAREEVLAGALVELQERGAIYEQ